MKTSLPIKTRQPEAAGLSWRVPTVPVLDLASAAEPPVATEADDLAASMTDALQDILKWERANDGSSTDAHA